MVDVNDATESQLRDALETRIEKDKYLGQKLEGYLKHDLYIFDDIGVECDYDVYVFELGDWGIFTSKDGEDFLRKLRRSKKKVASKGDRFISYQDRNELCWKTTSGHCEDMLKYLPHEWAKKHLSGIREVCDE